MTSSRTTDDDATASTDDALLGRRSVLSGGALAVGGAALLAGCGGTSATATGATGSSAATTPAAPTSAASTEDAGPLAQLADIPVGSAIAATLGGKAVVVAQPTAGTAVAFSAICTHKGCTVAPAGAKLNCPCHGSVFDAMTGKVLSGPASRALTSVPVTVKDGAVVAGSA
ncbi:MAG: Rieske (2Fe-2S) protein [Rhodoferax sp.]|nr:Rieske (2Fe-2S) protein [Actinomycetota bacterium]